MQQKHLIKLNIQAFMIKTLNKLFIEGICVKCLAQYLAYHKNAHNDWMLQEIKMTTRGTVSVWRRFI